MIASQQGGSADVGEQDEFRAGAALAFAAAGEVVGIVAGMQRAISRRGAGPMRAWAAAPIAIAGVAYAAARLGFAAGAGVVDVTLAASGVGRTHRPLQTTPWGRRVGAVLNGVIGDQLAEHYPALATPLRLRAGGHDLRLDAASLAAHCPDATGHVVVFLHGLIEDEDWWRRDTADFGQRLAEDLGVTALYVRYNTGRHVSDNARELSTVLTALVNAWPVEVTRISLVGHSMGGLVARGAVHHAVAEDEPWPAVLRDVICLGTPHRGSPVEQGANLAGWALRRFAESAPLAVLFTSRSSGIKDLRYGYIDEVEWRGQDPDALRRGTPRPTYRRAPDARQRFLAATLARDPAGLAGRLFGDLLVPPVSAMDSDLPAARQALGRLSHLDLLSHPSVYAQLRDWLTDAT